VVPSVIDANLRRFGERPNVHFHCGDPLAANFVAPAGDLLIIKDVVQHLSNANAKKLLDLTSRYRFSIITNDFAEANAECSNGDTRPLDIRVEPFNLRHAAVIMKHGGKATFLVVTAGL
jgi:hypothetical protein